MMRGGAEIAAVDTADAARPADHRADAEQHSDHRRGLEIGKFVAHLAQMTADDMAGLVRQHADDLVRPFRLHQRAGIDKNALGVDHEGVEGAVVDDDDPDIVLAQARRRAALASV